MFCPHTRRSDVAVEQDVTNGSPFLRDGRVDAFRKNCDYIPVREKNSKFACVRSKPRRIQHHVKSTRDNWRANTIRILL